MASTAERIEEGLKALIGNNVIFDGIPVYAKHDTEAAADVHPTILIECGDVNRMDDTPYQMHAYTCDVKVCLVTDFDNGTDFSPLEDELTCVFEDLPAMQSVFNYAGEPDERIVTGIHLHYADELNTSNEQEKTNRVFTVSASLMIERVEN